MLDTQDILWIQNNVRETSQELIEVNLTDSEIDSIMSYCSVYFPSHEISTKPSQFHYKGEVRNPNATGIIGEYAFCKGMKLGVSINEYLEKRPLRMSDKGDFRISGKIVDVKTNTWHSLPEQALYTNSYKGNVESKHLKKDFIYAFIFVTYYPELKRCYLMGYIRKDELAKKGKENKKGTYISETNFTFPCDAYDIHYASLEPIDKLTRLPIEQIYCS